MNDIKNEKLGLLGEWQKDKYLLDDVVDNFEDYNGKLEIIKDERPNKENVEILTNIDGKLKPYCSCYRKYMGFERKMSGKDSEAVLVDEMFSNISRKITERQPKIKDLESKIKKIANSYLNELSTEFDKQSRRVLEANNLEDSQRKKNKLNDIAHLYYNVKKNVLGNKKENRRIKRWIDFTGNLFHIAKEFLDVLCLYEGLMFGAKSNIIDIIKKLDFIEESYKKAVNQHRPFGFKKSIYDCGLELGRINEIKDNFDYVLNNHDEIENLKEKHLSFGEKFNLKIIELNKERMDDLRDSLEEKIKAKKTEERKEDSNMVGFSQITTIENLGCFSLPVFLDHIGLPDDSNYYPLFDALTGKFTRDWYNRLKVFRSILSDLRPKEDLTSIDYLKRIRFGLEKAIESGSLALDISAYPIRYHSLIPQVFSALDSYIAKCEERAIS